MVHYQLNEMDGTTIINRSLTAEELDLVNEGFDALSIGAGIELERTEQVSFVAMNGHVLIGALSGLAHKNGDLYSGWFHLTDLFVMNDHRNNGIGSDLLENLERRMRELGISDIWLWTSGDATLRFYDRHGYTTFAEMESWYSDGSSRFGLRKKLAQTH